MTARDQIAALKTIVEEARSMPMSASAVVNRAEVLELLEALDRAVAAELGEASLVLSHKDDMVDEGRQEAEHLIADARSTQERLASDTEVFRLAQRRAEGEVSEARAEADALRHETDQYVDGKLAGFEIALERTLETVRRGRERLAGRTDFDALSPAEVQHEHENPLPDHLTD